MNRRPLQVAIALTVLILLAVWTGHSPLPAQAASRAFKVAVLLPGSVNDQSWSQDGYEGLKLIERNLGALVAYTPNVSAAAAEAQFRRYAQQDYSYIIGHGSEYVPAAERVARAFPRTKFAVTAKYAGNNRNLGALSFRAGEVGYLVGVVAALKTQTKKVAFIEGEKVPVTLEDTALFQRGVKAIDPSVQVSSRWVGSWTDAQKAAAIAQEEIGRGVDVLVVNVDQAGPAFKVAEQAGAYAIGWSKDQYELAPHAVVTSVILRVPELLLAGATLVEEGRWEGRQYKFGIKEGAQYLAPFRGMLTPVQEARVRALMRGIRIGTIDVNP